MWLVRVLMFLLVLVLRLQLSHEKVCDKRLAQY
jgi:hypothetical protein